MSRNKDLFIEVRQITSNHFERGRGRYYEQQNADKNQMKAIKGTKINWK